MGINAAEKLVERPIVNAARTVSHDAGAVVEDAANALATGIEKIELPHDSLSFSQQLKSAGERIATAANGPNLSPESYASIAESAALHGDRASAHEFFSKAIDRTRSAGGALKILGDIKRTADQSAVAGYADNVTSGILNLWKEGLSKAAQHVKTPAELQQIIEHTNTAKTMAKGWKPSVNGFGENAASSWNHFVSGISALFSLGSVPMARKAAMSHSIDKIADYAVLQAANNAETVDAAKEIATFAENGQRYHSAEAALERARQLAHEN